MIFLTGSGRRRTSVGNREDLVARRELRVLGEVDDLDPVLPGKMRLADTLQIGTGRKRLCGLTSDIKPQLEGDGVAHRFAFLRVPPVLSAPRSCAMTSVLCCAVN